MWRPSDFGGKYAYPQSSTKNQSGLLALDSVSAGNNARLLTLERCNPWPHVAARQMSISQLL